MRMAMDARHMPSQRLGHMQPQSRSATKVPFGWAKSEYLKISSICDNELNIA
jgi:hypothetical protein